MTGSNARSSRARHPSTGCGSHARRHCTTCGCVAVATSSSRTGGRRRLGLVTDLRVDRQTAAVEGLAGHAAGILVRLGRRFRHPPGHRRRPLPRRHRPAGRGGEVATWVTRTRTRRAGLEIGELASAHGVPAVLDSGGLGRHTFMCGQSGSGKTYALGLLLERVLAETTIRVVVLDPNSDYVRLAHVREGAHPLLTARYSRVTERRRGVARRPGGRPSRCGCASPTWTRPPRRPSSAWTPSATGRSTPHSASCCASRSTANH